MKTTETTIPNQPSTWATVASPVRSERCTPRATEIATIEQANPIVKLRSLAYAVENDPTMGKCSQDIVNRTGQTSERTNALLPRLSASDSSTVSIGTTYPCINRCEEGIEPGWCGAAAGRRPTQQGTTRTNGSGYSPGRAWGGRNQGEPRRFHSSRYSSNDMGGAVP